MNLSKPIRVVASTILVIWLFVVIASYYIVHKPFGTETLLALLNELGDLLVWVILTAIAGAAGYRILHRFSFESPLEAGVFALGIGWAAVSFVTFGLGLVGLLNRILFWAISILTIILLRAEILRLWEQLRAIRVTIGSRFERGLVLFVGATLGLAFILALAPTVSWDAQIYHLLGPKTILAQGQILPPPDVVSMNYPSLIEMLYLAAMTLKGDGATSLIHLGFALLTFGAVFGFCTRFASSRIGLYAVAILCAVPTYILVAGWPYNDAALAFYSFAGLYALMIAMEKRDAKWFALAGTCAGLALGMKYTALVVVLAMLVLMWYDRQRLKPREWSIVLLACPIVACPWYLRNLAFTGNPVYPFFFGGRFWDAFRGYWYALPGSGLLNDPARLLLAPWDATILGQEGRASYEATITPLMLAFLPVLVLIWKRVRIDRILRAVFVFSSILFFFWLVGIAASRSLIQTRLLFPAFPGLAILTGVSIDYLPNLDLPRFSTAHFAKMGVALVLALTLVSQGLGFLAADPLPYLAGLQTRDAYLASRLGPGYWDAMQFIGRLQGAKVLFLWEPRGYYVPNSTQVQTDEILDNFRDLRHQYHDAPAIARALNKEGYEYILLARWGLDFELRDKYSGMSADDVEILSALTGSYAVQVYGAASLDHSSSPSGQVSLQNVDRDPYAVYRLLPGSVAAQ
jgi:4-amino-4-deoxy-L-arabinose transferase-like glycosyltransferase